MLFACGGGDNVDSENGETPDPNALAREYCNCLEEEDTSPCLEMSIEHAKKLASLEEAFEMYSKITEECGMKKLEEAAEAAADAVDDAMEKVEDAVNDAMDKVEEAVDDAMEEVEEAVEEATE